METYNQIAEQWHEYLKNSTYGRSGLLKAIEFHENPQSFLDLGCGDGRLLPFLPPHLSVHALDSAVKMLQIAQKTYPQATFYHADICNWKSVLTFDVIFAYDSLFHLPLAQYLPVLAKLYNLLNPKGILAYTFGTPAGTITEKQFEVEFTYTSIGEAENLAFLESLGFKILHLEHNAQNHAFVIAQKL
jgi:trans-aconitate methyltransferase